MLDWKAEAKQLRRERDEAIDQRARILDDLEDLIHKHDPNNREAVAYRWPVNASSDYVCRRCTAPHNGLFGDVCKVCYRPGFDAAPCIMCGDPFVQRSTNVCDSCWRAETGE